MKTRLENKGDVNDAGGDGFGVLVLAHVSMFNPAVEQSTTIDTLPTYLT